VRRIPDLNKTGVDAQGELFAVWRYHAAFTDSPFVLVQAEEQHTVATPSSNKSSPNSSTDPWPTYPQAGSTPTTPG
jgi:hypothetical protein